jgi:hypothetical protein
MPRIAVLPGRKVTARLAPARDLRPCSRPRALACALQVEQLESLLGRAPPAYQAVLAVMAARLLNLHGTAVAKRNVAQGLPDIHKGTPGHGYICVDPNSLRDPRKARSDVEQNPMCDVP